jgi:hypothetical protein
MLFVYALADILLKHMRCHIFDVGELCENVHSVHQVHQVHSRSRACACTAFRKTASTKVPVPFRNSQEQPSMTVMK